MSKAAIVWEAVEELIWVTHATRHAAIEYGNAYNGFVKGSYMVVAALTDVNRRIGRPS